MTRLIIALLVAAAAQAQVTYKVHFDRTVELDSERYVAAVVSGECGTFRSPEAMKAMAVAARTYAARLRGRHAAEGYDFCATTHCQRALLADPSPAVSEAVRATAGELLWYEGKPAFAVYALNCGSHLEDVDDVWPGLSPGAPYLTARPDPYCVRHGARTWSWSATPAEIAGALRAEKLNAPAGLDRIAIAQRTASGRAKTLELLSPSGQAAMSASSFQLAMGRRLGWNTLRSNLYEVQSSSGRIAFQGAGIGHGVGLCQTGADEMGIEGFSYREILAFYYPGTSVSTLGSGLHWSRLAGGRVVLLSTRPESDGPILHLADKLEAETTARAAAPPAPSPITVRIYPDIETFRNATGEPGWVAAHTRGATIDLQPAALLRSRGVLTQTLRHELFHVAVEREAAPGLPVWFREGLVLYLNGDQAAPPTSARDSRAQAEASYADARARVARLVQIYGEATVLGWARRGLPAWVTNSSASSAATNNR